MRPPRSAADCARAGGAATSAAALAIARQDEPRTSRMSSARRRAHAPCVVQSRHALEQQRLERDIEEDVLGVRLRTGLERELAVAPLDARADRVADAGADHRLQVVAADEA